MNFGTLKSRLLAQIGRAPSELCYDLVTADVNHALRVHQMAEQVTLVEAETVNLPGDYLAMISIYRDTDPRTTLEPISQHGLHKSHASSGVPCFYAVEDGQLRLSPAPNGSESLVLRYYAKVAALEFENDTNVVLTNYPAVYVYGCLAHHAALSRDDEGLSKWFPAYQLATKQAQTDSNKYRAGSAPMRVTPRSVA